MVTISMTSGKMATLDLLNIKVFLSKVYDVITYVHDVTKNFSILDSNFIVDVVM